MPFDQEAHVIHILSVLAAAKALAAAAARSGLDFETMPYPALKEPLATLCDEANRLAVYETRGRQRGTVTDLTARDIARTVTKLRETRTLTADEEELLSMQDADIDAAFELSDVPPVEETADPAFDLDI